MVYPEISIISPGTGASFDYGDTLLVEAEVRNLEGAIQVNLMDGAQVTGPGFIKVSDHGNRYLFRAIFDDPNLDQKTYTIRVSAYHGENRASEFQSISYRELVLSRLGFAMLSDQSGVRKLFFLPVQGTLEEKTLTGDYSYLAVTPLGGRIATAPAYTGKLTSYNKSLDKLFEVLNPAPGGSLQYRKLISDQSRMYAMDNEGYIRAFSDNGNPERNFQLPQGMIPMQAAFNRVGDFLVAAAEPGFNAYKLLLLNPLNGYVLKSAELSLPPVGVSWSGSDFVILCADGGASVILKYDPQADVLTEWARIPGENPVDISGTSAHSYVATDAGLYPVYAGSGPNQPVKRVGDRITSKSVNDLSGTLNETSVFFASGSEIYEYNGTTLQLVNAIQNQNILRLEVLYNK